MAEKEEEPIDINGETQRFLHTAVRLRRAGDLLRKWERTLREREASLKTDTFQAERALQKRLDAVQRKERQVKRALDAFRNCTETVSETKHDDSELETEAASEFLTRLASAKRSVDSTGSHLSPLRIQPKTYSSPKRGSWFGGLLSWKKVKKMTMVRKTEVLKSPLRAKNVKKRKADDQSLVLFNKMNGILENACVDTVKKQKVDIQSCSDSVKSEKENLQTPVSPPEGQDPDQFP